MFRNSMLESSLSYLTCEVPDHPIFWACWIWTQVGDNFTTTTSTIATTAVSTSINRNVSIGETWDAMRAMFLYCWRSYSARQDSPNCLCCLAMLDSKLQLCASFTALVGMRSRASWSVTGPKASPYWTNFTCTAVIEFETPMPLCQKRPQTNTAGLCFCGSPQGTTPQQEYCLNGWRARRVCLWM